MGLGEPIEAMLAECRLTLPRVPYSDSDWAAIVALLARLPTPPKAEVEARFRFDIECSAYLIKSSWKGPTTKPQWIVAWQTVAKASEKLRDALAVVTEEEAQEVFDAWCSDRIDEANENIRSIATQLKRRKIHKPALAQVVRQLFELWTHCGGKIRRSTGAPNSRDKNLPTGPLLRFLKTATNPMFLAEPLSNDTLSYFIKKEIRKQKRG